jgi:hypothetical protein
MTHQRDWIDILQAFGPSIAALVALSVGLMQWYLQRLNLKQALYDKRFSVRQHVLKYFSTTYTAERPIEREFVDAMRLTSYHARDLFGSDVTEFLKRISDDQTRTYQKREAWDAATSRGEGTDICMKEYNEAMAKLRDDCADITEVFNPYLQLHNDQPFLVRLEAMTDRYFDRWDRILASRRDRAN